MRILESKYFRLDNKILENDRDGHSVCGHLLWNMSVSQYK